MSVRPAILCLLSTAQLACNGTTPTPAATPDAGPRRPITAPDAPVPTFAVQTSGLSPAGDGTFVVISFSDLDGASGCALSAGLDSVVSVDAHQLVATVASASTVCPSGVYPMMADCPPTAPGAAAPFVECAEYRRWGASGRQQSTVARTGTVTLQQTWVDRDTADCDVAVDLGFASGAVFAGRFTVRVDQAGAGAPFCR